MTNPMMDPSKFSVLIVDDQVHVRDYVKALLARMGVTRVAEAPSGRAALAAVSEPGARFDLVLCDLRMPDGDGIETIRRLAELQIDTWFAILSIEDERVIDAAAVLSDAQGLRLLGALSKPLTIEKLEQLFAKLSAVGPVAGIAVEPISGDDIAPAFVRGEFRMAYQPKVDMRSGRFAGVEALVRWEHPRRGLLDAGIFVSLLEASEVHLRALTDYTIQEAIACAGRWQHAGRELNVAINVPASAFDRLDFPERAESLCREQQVNPATITIEITETQVAQDPIRMLDVATRLRLKGFSLSVDDFGTGHSSLAQLQRLPFTELKIDRQFVNGCHASPTKRAVVDASLALARSLKLTSVAEGVQNRLDWDLLASLGCDIMQGFFVSRPLSESGLEAWALQWMLREAQR